MNLYRDTHFTFRFAEDRIVPRFHLEGVEAGRRVTVFELAESGEPGRVLAKAIAGEGGWVDLTQPLVVRTGGGFVAVPACAIRNEATGDAEGIRSANRLA